MIRPGSIVVFSGTTRDPTNFAEPTYVGVVRKRTSDGNWGVDWWCRGKYVPLDPDFVAKDHGEREIALEEIGFVDLTTGDVSALMEP